MTCPVPCSSFVWAPMERICRSTQSRLAVNRAQGVVQPRRFLPRSRHASRESDRTLVTTDGAFHYPGGSEARIIEKAGLDLKVLLDGDVDASPCREERGFHANGRQF